MSFTAESIKLLNDSGYQRPSDVIKNDMVGETAVSPSFTSPHHNTQPCLLSVYWR